MINIFKKTGNQTFNCNLTINSAKATDTFLITLKVFNPNIATNSYITACIGKSMTSNECRYLWYKEPGICGLGIRGEVGIIYFTKSEINLVKPTTINSNLTVSGTITNHYNKTECDEKYARSSKP